MSGRGQVPAANCVPARSTGTGFGRLLVAVYALLALAATARGTVQLASRAAEAPLAYSLSVASGVVYLVAAVALARGGRWRPVAWAAVAVEALGVALVGTWSVLDPAAFPHDTVWSGFGRGYGWLPAALPVAGLWWLWRTRERGAGTVEGQVRRPPAPIEHEESDRP